MIELRCNLQLLWEIDNLNKGCKLLLLKVRG